MITSEREDYLIAQYVWVIQNVAEYTEAVQRFVAFDYFGSLEVECEKWMRKIVRDIRRDDPDEILSIAERAFITLVVWQQANGNMKNTQAQFKRCQMIVRESQEPQGEPKELKQEIEQHMEAAQVHLDRVAAELNRIEKERQMSQIAFQTKSYVYGKDVSTMTEEELIQAIKAVESEIANLGQVKTASKKIDAKKAELEKMLSEVVAVLDAK